MTTPIPRKKRRTKKRKSSVSAPSGQTSHQWGLAVFCFDDGEQRIKKKDNLTNNTQLFTLIAVDAFLCCHRGVCRPFAREDRATAR
ncbi:hypothetical protein GT748_07100 [Bittarella massiliensis]|uniref:Uncharacterized protein n=1 Tax=Bittarella massiliensis (ex Durand et al. 2017) TaxID=1720313 RepID=A0ABW9WUM6_9FIRM|nr:hypothetical protein [Bittarella massiliensis (ex Durand et al. 2017)]MZL80398.1 hypothetical protein [Bittarella massiliensis (ex Durand et al. 2017)]